MSLLMLFRFGGEAPPPLEPDLSFAADDGLWQATATDRQRYAVLVSEDPPHLP